jgi:polyisoprenoid-binding protein YceI
MSWEIDPYNSLIEFSARHLMIATIKGRFNDVHGTIELHSQYPERSSVTAQIQTDSLNTGMAQRDAHLRSSDFFEVTKYPLISFKSTRIKVVGQNRAIIEGDLSLHGVTKSISLQTTYTGANPDPFTDAWRIAMHAVTVFDRRNFGMTFKQDYKGITVIGYETRIELHIEALQV